jgi:nickel-dependent lactate racemase
MKTLEKVRTQLAAGEFEFSRHAFKRVVERNVSDQEIRQAGTQVTIIEDYPDDKYSPSCLLLGFTPAGRPLHIQVSLADTDLVIIITLYEPDPNEWVNYSRRR